MEKIWLKSYPPDVPAQVDVAAYRSLAHLFDATVEKFGSAPAFENFGARVSFTQVEILSRRLGAWLQAQGLQRGDRVAVMMPNLLQYPTAIFGILRAGFVVVNCNPLYSVRELAGQLADSGAKILIVLQNFAHIAQRALPGSAIRLVVTTQIGDLLGFPKGRLTSFVVKRVKKLVPEWSIPGAISFRAALREGARANWAAAELGPDDLAFLQYTGGTTGTPKAAMLTHGNIVANLEQCYAWMNAFIAGEGETAITALPLYHIFALTGSCLIFFKAGVRNALITNPRDIPGFVKELRRIGSFSMITGVNTLFNALLHNSQFRQLDFSKLRISLGGGMSVHRGVAQRWKEVTGRPLIEGYGLTETSPTVTINPLDLSDWNGSIGLPIPSTDIAIRDDSGADLPLEEAGELCVRGPQVMKGYWMRPDETEKVMTPDGFLRTGDIATVDHAGFVRIVDRKKDMILVSGFNVYPNEVEEVLGMHPSVLEAAVIGVPDANSGEAVKAIVVKRDPALTAAEITSHCREHLASYKIPRHFEFRTELPKSNVGKILRRELREKPSTQA
jgi:long-chain acyl-CoA synthetase